MPPQNDIIADSACLGMYPLCPGKKELIKIPGLAKAWKLTV